MWLVSKAPIADPNNKLSSRLPGSGGLEVTHSLSALGRYTGITGISLAAVIGVRATRLETYDSPNSSGYLHQRPNR